MGKLNRNSSKGNQRLVATGNFAAALFVYQEYDDDFKVYGSENEVIIGAGIRQVGISQDFVSEAVPGLGYSDVLYADSGVRGTTLQLSRAMLIPAQLEAVGITGYGIDNWSRPNISVRIFDSGWAQQGKNISYLRADGLHLVRNSIEFNAQATVMENVSFNVDRLRADRDEDDYAAELLAAFKKNFSELYGLAEGYQQFGSEFEVPTP